MALSFIKVVCKTDNLLCIGNNNNNNGGGDDDNNHLANKKLNK